MSEDPRAVFRRAPRNCGSCEHWPRHILEFMRYRQNEPIELPCTVIESKTYVEGENNYARGWRRASDSCAKWSRS